MNRATRRFALGSYTADLHLAERSAAGAWRIIASAPASNPSFVARSADLLFAVGENASGSVASFRIEGGADGADPALVRIDSVEHGEADPCHVVVDETSGLLFVANYTGGSVTVVPFEPSGTLGRPATLPLPQGTGPVTGRQDAPHAHQVVPTPWGTHVVSDLGGDAIHELAAERSTDGAPPTVRITRTIDVAAGTGPRHMLVRSGYLHVIGELDWHLHTFEVDASSARPAGTEPAVIEPPRSADDVVQPSHLDASPSGRLFTALVRGRDTVTVFEGTDPGYPHLADEHAIGAAWPRHHAHLDDRTIVVAAQGGNALVELDLVTGSTRRVLDLTAPTCVLPLD